MKLVKVKKIYKKINSTRAAVSILLALLMSPLLSISLILVESARYQSAVQMINELSDSSAFSALAKYDRFIEKRFGILGTNGDKEVKDIFSDYMEKNKKAFGNTVEIKENYSSGTFPLSHTSVLKQQLLEVSEINVPLGTINSFVDFSKLSEAIKNIFKDKKEDIEKQKKEHEKIVKDIENLKEKLEKLQNEVKDKKEKIIKDRDSIESDNLYKENQKEIEKKLKDKNYDLDDDFWKVHKNFIERYKTLLSIKNYLSETFIFLNENRKEFERFKEIYTENKNKEIFDIVKNTISEIDDLNKLLKKYVDGNREMDSLENIMYIPNENNKIPISRDYYKEFVVGIITEDIKDRNYETFDDCLERFKEWDNTIEDIILVDISPIIDKMKKFEDEKFEADKNNGIKEYFNVFNEILGIFNEAISNSELNANIRTDILINKDVGANDAKNIEEMFASIQEIKKDIESNSIFKFLKVIIDISKVVVKFFQFIINWITGIVTGGLWDNPSNIYNKFLLSGYATYNLSNRKNYNKGNNIFGDSYTNCGLGKGGAFKGAEAEYIIAGLNNEEENQRATFFNIYMFRLVCDIIPVLNATKSISSSFPVGTIVSVLIALTEPLLDTIILAKSERDIDGGNKEEAGIDLIKETIFLDLSGNGIEDAINKLGTCISEDRKNKLNTSFEKIRSINKNKGYETIKNKGTIFKSLGYKEHLLLLMLIKVNEEQYLKRMQNLIQISGKGNVGESFDLRTMYTGLNINIEYQLNPMLPIDAFSKGFTIKSKRFVGY